LRSPDIKSHPEAITVFCFAKHHKLFLSLYIYRCANMLYKVQNILYFTLISHVLKLK
jgi:hypothetical protein